MARGGHDSHIRIGIDTGGTFTDVVAFDETTGELTTTKTAVHARRPGRRVHGRRSQDARRCSGDGTDGDRVGQPRHHGRDQPAARGQGRRGSASSPPRATSSSWRSPGSPCRTATATPTSGSSRTGSCRPTWSRRSAAGWTTPAPRCGRSTRTQAVEVARWFRDRGIATLGVCFLHSYANPEHERRMRRDPARASTRDAVVSLSSRGAARVPRVRAGDDDAGRRRGEAEGGRRTCSAIAQRLDALRRQPAHPVLVMRSNGGVLSADEVVNQPISTVLSGPAAGALGAALIAARRRLSTGCSPATAAAPRPTSAVVLDGEPALTTEGRSGSLPVQDPDDRRGDGRRRRWVDRLGVARRARSRSGRGRPAPIPGRSATAGAAPRSPSPTRTWCWAGSRRTCSAARCRWTPAAARAGLAELATRLGLAAEDVRGGHPGDLRLEPGQRAAPDHRQARPGRPRLHAGHVRRFGFAAAVPADRHPRACTACWCRRTRATCRPTGC